MSSIHDYGVFTDKWENRKRLNPYLINYYNFEKGGLIEDRGNYSFRKPEVSYNLKLIYSKWKHHIHCELFWRACDLHFETFTGMINPPLNQYMFLWLPWYHHWLHFALVFICISHHTFACLFVYISDLKHQKARESINCINSPASLIEAASDPAQWFVELNRTEHGSISFS